MAGGDTLCEVFWSAVRKHGGRPAQEWYEDGAWKSRTYSQFGAAVRDVAHGLLASGVKKGDRVAIWSKNCPQWGEVDFANQTAGFVTVLNDSDARVLFVQDATILERVLSVRSNLKTVKTIVLIHGRTTADGVLSYADFVAKGRAFGAENPKKLDQMAAKVEPADIASLVYTSGTTGDPKGAVLTQGNFATNSSAMDLVQVGPEDVFLSFLPLSHVFERTGGHFGAYRLGAKVVFARSVDTLMDDMQTAKPTIMMSVPRLYEKMYSRMTENVAKSSFIKRAIFDWAMAQGRAANVYRERNEPLPKGLESKVRRADKLVFHKVKDRVGGHLRYFVSGGAALSKDIEEFFWAAGINILQGYGLTETAPVCNVNTPTSIRFGSVGRTIPGVQLKIDTNEWVAAKPRPAPEGEICYKGPNVFQGYWKNDAATKECFDRDGWFHTGDIGYVDSDGFLFITDRKKEIIVMSNGKKVPPQAIENDLKIQPHIAQAMVVGDDRLIVPNWETLEKFCLENGIGREDRVRLVADQRVVSLFEREVEAVNSKLSRYEQIKKFWVLPAEWTVETGELTPSLKIKRRIILDKQKESLRKLYPAEDAVVVR